MTWKEDRDALIAQTMAFVQAVTGKPADFSQFELPSAATKAAVSPQPPVTALPVTPLPDAARTASTTAALASLAPAPEWREPPREVPERSGQAEPSDLNLTADAETRRLDLTRADRPRREAFTSIASQLDLQRDMQAEIRARVARFRAHQERFNRERQEYFSATLERLKASATGTVIPED
jgi:hypothetical protein